MLSDATGRKLPQVTPDATRTPTTSYMTAVQVRARYGGVSDMALWRWLHDPRYEAMNFPRPMRINGRRLWKESDLVAFERRCHDNGGEAA